MFVGATRIRQMTDEVAIQFVNVDTTYIVKLLALKAKHLVTIDHGNMGAAAIQYIAIHDRPPMHEYPGRRLRPLVGDSETNPRAISPWPLAGRLDASEIPADLL